MRLVIINKLCYVNLSIITKQNIHIKIVCYNYKKALPEKAVLSLFYKFVYCFVELLKHFFVAVLNGMYYTVLQVVF